MNRTTAIKLPISQVVVLGMGVVALSNPDKFFSMVQKTSQFASLLTADAGNINNKNGSSTSSIPPIIIQQTSPPPSTPPSSKGGDGGYYFIVQIVVGAGVCWGSYIVLTNVLPEAAKGLLPVTTTAFNSAVSSLGRAVINLKDTLMEQILGLQRGQTELKDKQEQTHQDVVVVKENVMDLKETLRVVQESLDLCHQSLSENERQSSQIARGVQLLTRGVSTFLPEDDPLLHDLIAFNETCTASTSQEQPDNMQPDQLQQLQELLNSLHENAAAEAQAAGGLPYATVMVPPEVAADPENEIPTVDSVERSVAEVQVLLDNITGAKRLQ